MDASDARFGSDRTGLLCGYRFTPDEAGEAIELRGHAIPKGAQILLSQWVVHRDPRFFPNPEGFDPDRWEPERASRLPRYAYFPFGGGPRVCIGNHFAMMEATLVLAVISRDFRLDLVGEFPVGRAEVTLRPAGPMPMHVSAG